MKVSEFGFVTDAQNHILKVVELWSLLKEWESDSHLWIGVPVLDLNAGEIKQKVTNTKKKLQKLSESFTDRAELSRLASACYNSLNQFDTNYLELISILRHESFKERHWKELLSEIYKTDAPKLEKLTFKQLIDKNIKAHKSFLTFLAEKAQNQYIVEFRIDDIERSICNTQVMVRHSTRGHLVINNEQSVFAAFAEHKEKCEDMLRASEHLEAFLQQIYRVYGRICRLEEVFKQLITLQELVTHMKAVRAVPSLAKELTKKDVSVLDAYLIRYHNVLEDMNLRGLAHVMKGFVEGGDKDEDEESPTLSPKKETSTQEYLDLIQQAFNRISEHVQRSVQSSPRLLFLSAPQLCDIVHSSMIAKKLVGLNTFFPEISSFAESESGPAKITQAKTSRGEVLVFPNGVNIELLPTNEIFDQLRYKVQEIEREIHRSLKGSILKGLNFFIANNSNFEKYLVSLLDSRSPFQSTETVLRCILSNDLSLLLDNPIVPTSAKETTRAKLSKYLGNITGPLRKFNLVTYKEIVVEGKLHKFKMLESFIFVLTYMAEVVSDFVRLGEYDYNGFYWQSKLKVCLQMVRDRPGEDISKPQNMETLLKAVNFSLKENETIPNFLAMVVGAPQLYTDGFDININAFDKSVKYGYQISSENESISFMPRTEKGAVSLLLGISNWRMHAMKGQDKSGKTSTVRYLSRLCGKYCGHMDLSLVSSSNLAMNYMLFTVGTGSWLTISNLHEAPYSVLAEMAKVIFALKKHYEVSNKKQFLIERVEYSLTHDYNFFMIQNSMFFKSPNYVKIPSAILSEFRSCSIITCDMFTFIYSQLSDLIYFEDLDSRYVENFSRSLLLFFQLMSNGLSDKVFLTSQVSHVTPAVPEFLVQEVNTWRMSLSSIRPLLEKIKMALKLEQSKITASKTVFRVIYAALRYQLSVQQREALMLNFLAVFEPKSEMFSVTDKSYQHQAGLIHNFFVTNKIPAYTNISIVENMHLLADTVHDQRKKVYVNFGLNLEVYSDSFCKLLIFMLAKKLVVSSAMGFRFNLAYLDKEELSGTATSDGLLQSFLLSAKSKDTISGYYSKGTEHKRFSAFRLETATFLSANMISVASTNPGDALIFDAFSLSDNLKVEYLCTQFLSPSIPTLSEGAIPIPTDLSLVINMQSLATISPAILPSLHLNHFMEDFIPEDFLSLFVSSRLNWDSPWSVGIDRLAQAFSDEVVQHIVYFIKKNKEPTALVYWNNDLQFYRSLGMKIVAALKELEALYPIETRDPVKSRESIPDFTSDAECCFIFCLIAEVENHLRNFMQVSASKFLVETIRVAHEKKDTKKGSSSSSSSSSSSKSSGSSSSSSSSSSDSNLKGGASDRKNVAMINLIATLEAKPRETVFNYCYDIRKRKWIPWAEYERAHILQLEQREIAHRNFEPEVGTQPRKSIAPTGVNNPRKSMNKVQGKRMSRKSFANFGFGPNNMMPNPNAAPVPKNVRVTNLTIPELTKVEFWCLILSRYGMPFSCLSNNTEISRLASKQIRQTLEGRQISLAKAECELLFSKQRLNIFSKRFLINAQSSVNVVVDDLHIQSSDLCLASYFIDAFAKRAAYRFGEGYWPTNIFSISMFCAFPESDHLLDLFSTNHMINTLLSNCSSMTVKHNRSEDLIRIFTHAIPSKMKTEATIRIVARLANFYHNYSMNINYVQNNLKRNLSPQAWMNAFKVLGYFSNHNLSSGTRIAAAFLQVSKLLLLDQLEGITFAEPEMKVKSGMELMVNKLSVALPLKKMHTFKIDPVHKGASTSSEEELTSSESSSGEEEAEEEQKSEESDQDKNSHTESSDSDSCHEEIGTLVQIDTLLAPEETRAEKGNALSPAKGDGNQRASMSQDPFASREKIDDRKGSFVSNVALRFKMTSMNALPVIRQETNEKSGNIQPSDSSIDLKANQGDLSKFDFRTKLTRQKGTFFDDPDEKKEKVLPLPSPAQPTLNAGRSLLPGMPINLLPAPGGRRSRKTGQSGKANADPNDKVKVAKISNIVTADNIQRTVARESALDWNDFDIYAGDNKYDIKGVLKQFIEAFSNNLSLNVTLDKNSAHLLTNYTENLALRNSLIGKKRPPQKSSSMFQPSFTLINYSEAKERDKSFFKRYFILFNNTMKAIFVNDILSLEKSEQFQKQLPSCLELISLGHHTKSSRSKKENSDIRYLFVGSQLDHASIEYFLANLRTQLGTILNSSAKDLPKRAQEINFLFEIPGLLIVTDSRILPWIAVIAINFVLIFRRMKLIDYVRNSTIEDLKKNLKSTIEEAILHGEKVTIFIDFNRYLDDNPSPHRGIQEVFHFVSLCQNGEILDEYPSEVLQNIITALRKEDYMMTLAYDDLVNQIKRIIEQNLNFVFISRTDFCFEFNSLLHRNHPGLFSRSVFRVFKEMDIASNFEKTVHYKLLSYAKNSRPTTPISGEDSLKNQHREDKDSLTLRQRLKESFISLDRIDEKRLNKTCTVGQERMWTILDVGLAMGVYYTQFEKRMYLDAVSAIEKCIFQQTMGHDLSASLDSVCLEMSKTMVDFNLAKLMHMEDGFIRVILDGLILSGTQVNIIATVHLLLMDEYSFVPLVYDPLGYCSAYFKTVSSIKNSFVFIEGAEAGVETLAKQVESGSKIVLHLHKLGRDMKIAVANLLKGIAVYQFGKDLEYFNSRSRAPPVQIGDTKVTMGDGFRVAFVFRRRQDLLEILQRFKGSFVLDMIKLVAFEESITSLFTSVSAVYRELDTGVRFHEWMTQILNQLRTEDASSVFGQLNDFSNIFGLNELTTTKALSFNRPDETKFSFDYLDMIRQICGLNWKDSSRAYTLVIQDICRITIQFKVRTAIEVPFDSTYQERFLTVAVADVSTSYQKMLFYFSKVRGSDNPGVDAAYLFNILSELLEQLKNAQLQKSSHKNQKIEGEGMVSDLEHKTKLGFISEKLIRALEAENPTIWTQLLVAFTVHCYQILTLKERPFFTLWIWMNHFEHSNATFKRLAYSNTLVKRATLLPTSGPLKLLNSENEMEQRDLIILVNQSILQAGDKDLTADSDYEPATARTPVSMRGKVRVSTYKQDIKKIYIDLHGMAVDDTFVNIDPFLLPKRENNMLGGEERIAPPPPVVLMQRTSAGAKSTSPKEAEDDTEVKRFSKAQKILALQNSKPQYKKSRFAPGGPAHGKPLPAIPEQSSGGLEKKDGAGSKKVIQTIVEKTDESVDDKSRMDSEPDSPISPLPHSPRRLASPEGGGRNLDRLRQFVSTSRKGSSPMGPAKKSIFERKNSEVKEKSDSISGKRNSGFNNALSLNKITSREEQKSSGQSGPLKLEPVKPAEEKSSDSDSIENHLKRNKHLDSEEEDSEPKKKMRRFATKGRDLSDSEEDLEDVKGGIGSFADNRAFQRFETPMKKGKKSKIKQSEVYTKKISYNFSKLKKKNTEVEGPGQLSPVKTAVRQFKAQNEVPAELKKVINDRFSKPIAKAITYILEMSAESDNFKAYLAVFKEIVERLDEWKTFYIDTPSNIYSTERQLRLPLTKYDAKQSTLTYTEILNLLYIFRPFELAPYLYSLPYSNKYLYSVRPVQSSYPRSSRLALLSSSEPILFNILGFVESAVHCFMQVSLEELEKVAGEGKLMIIYRASEWPETELKLFLAKAKFLTYHYSKFRLWIVEEGTSFYPDLLSVFDYYLNCDVDSSVKELCTYFLSVQSGYLFNTWSYAPSANSELYEMIEKINYEYSKEIKFKTNKITDATTMRHAFARASIVIDLSYSVDLVKSLNDQTSNKNSLNFDENRATTTTYLLMSAVLKTIKSARDNYGVGFFLSAFDVASITHSINIILETQSDSSSKSYLNALDLLFFYEGSASSILQPITAAPKLIEFFNSHLHGVYEGSKPALTIENQSYTILTRTFKRNNQELLQTIAGFPSFDPNVLGQQSDRDRYLKSKQQSSGLFDVFRTLSNNGLLRIGFRHDFRISDTRGREFRALTEQDVDGSVISWADHFAKKMSLLQILNLLGAITMPNLIKCPLMTVLNNLKTEARELQSDYDENEEEKDRVKKEKKNRQAKRNTLKLATGGSPRKSIVESLRTETQKQLAVPMNNTRRASFIKEMEKKDGVNFRGLKLASILNPGPINQKSKQKRARGDNRGQDIRDRGPRFSVSNHFGKASTNMIYTTDIAMIELKMSADKVKKELLRRARMCQSQAWLELLMAKNFHNLLTRTIVHKFEIFSGEICPFFNEDENAIINEKSQFGKLGYHSQWDQHSLHLIFHNLVPQWMQRSMPVNLMSCNFDSSFASFWLNIKKRISYVQHLASTDEAFPMNGSYDLSKLFRPVSLLLNFAFLFALKNKRRVELVSFHCVLYSDFDNQELNLPVLRIHGLQVINGRIDDNGMLMPHTGNEFDTDVPMLVFLPYFSHSNQDSMREKSFNIHLRKNARTTLTARKLFDTPGCISSLDNTPVSTPMASVTEFNDRTAFSANSGDHMHTVRLPILLSGESLGEYESMGNIKWYIHLYSFQESEYWRNKGTYLTVKTK